MRKWSTQYPLHAAGNKFFLSCLYHTHTLIIPLLLKLWEICTSSLHNCQTFWTFLKILSGQFQDDCEACRAVSICWTGLCIHSPSRLGRVRRERIFVNYWSRFVQARCLLLTNHQHQRPDWNSMHGQQSHPFLIHQLLYCWRKNVWRWCQNPEYGT